MKLTKEQREAVEWAAGQANSYAKTVDMGKTLMGQRQRALSELLSAHPDHSGDGGEKDCAHDYVRPDKVCTECGEKAAPVPQVGDAIREVVAEMIAVATAEEELDFYGEWTAANRAQIDKWQARIAQALEIAALASNKAAAVAVEEPQDDDYPPTESSQRAARFAMLQYLLRKIILVHEAGDKARTPLHEVIKNADNWLKENGLSSSKVRLAAAHPAISGRFNAHRLKVAEECNARLMSACTEAGCPDGVNMADWILDLAKRATPPAPIASTAAPRAAALAVWYGSMPESNGKTNWTAILHNGDIASGMTIDRSEYPDRVRYEADRVRWLIGDLDKEPFILDYDADKHSGYTHPAAAQPSRAEVLEEAILKCKRHINPALKPLWNEAVQVCVDEISALKDQT